MGSSSPVESGERAERLGARGVGWVDAPVSGGAEGAAAASLAIMAGGSDEDVARVRPGARDRRSERRARRRARRGPHDEGGESGDRRPGARGGRGGARARRGGGPRPPARAAGAARRLGRLADPPGPGNAHDRAGLRARRQGQNAPQGSRHGARRSPPTSVSSCPTSRARSPVFEGLVERGDGDLDCAAIYTPARAGAVTREGPERDPTGRMRSGPYRSLRAEGDQRSHATRDQVGDGPRPEPRSRGLRASEGPEIDDRLGHAAGVRREIREAVLIESLERQHPRCDTSDVLQRLGAERLAELTEKARGETGAEDHEHGDAVRGDGEEDGAEERNAARIRTASASSSAGITARSGHQPPIAPVIAMAAR